MERDAGAERRATLLDGIYTHSAIRYEHPRHTAMIRVARCTVPNSLSAKIDNWIESRSRSSRLSDRNVSHADENLRPLPLEYQGL